MNKYLLLPTLGLILLSILLFIFQLQEPIDTFFYSYFSFNDTLTSIFKFITIFANAAMIIIVLIMITYYLKKQRRIKEGLEFTCFTVLSLAFLIVLKYLFQRQRPSIKRLIEITGFSFPSGHAYTSIIIYGYIIYLVNRDTKGKRKIVCISILSSLIALIGISRIYLGVHYLTDILFGYSLGFLNIQLFLYYQKKKCKTKQKI